MTKLKKCILSVMLACVMFLPNIFAPMVAWASAFYEPSKVKDYVFSSGSTWVVATPHSKPVEPKPEDYVTEDYPNGEENPKYTEAKEKYEEDLKIYLDHFQQYVYASSGSTGNLVYSFIDTSSAEWKKTDDAYSTEVLNKYGLSTEKYGNINLDPMDGTTNQKYLLLNAVNNGAMFAYKTNSTFTMDANSFYHISFVVKTLGESTTASIGISGELEHAVQEVNTNGEWVQYDLYISTKASSSSKVNLEVGLGNFTDDTAAGYSTGAVLFSTAQVYKISYSDFAEAKYNKTSTTSFFYNQSSNILANPDFDDASPFTDWKDNTNSNWAIWYDEDIAESSKAKYDAKIVEETTEEALQREETVGEGDDATTEKKPSYPSFPTNFGGESVLNPILKLTNNGKAMEMALRSAPITILQQGFYKISVFAKAVDKDAELKIRAYTEIATGGDPNKEFSKEVTANPYKSASTSDIYNGWQEYTIYVQGHSLRNTQIYLDLFAGSNSTIYIDHISVQRVDYNAYNKANNKLDLAPSTLVAGDSIMSNASFNWAATEGIQQEDVAYPVPAKSWSSVASEKEDYKDFAVTSGIIPTNGILTDATTPGVVTNGNPISAEDIYKSKALNDLLTSPESGVTALPEWKNLNIFMMSTFDAETKTYNATQYFTRTSSTFTLSSSKVYEITFQVYVVAGAENITCSLLFGDAVMSTINITNNTTTDQWQTYKFYVQTDGSSKSLKLQFGFGDTVLDTAGKGTFFVADFRTKTIDKTEDKTTDELFAEKANVAIETQEQQHYTCLDFKYENWTMIAADPDRDANKGLYTINNYKKHEDSTSENVYVGVLDTSKNDYPDIIFSGVNANDVNTAEGAEHNQVLVINHEEAGYTYLQPSVTKTLSQNNYYEITFRVKTTALTGAKLTISIPKLNFAWTEVETVNSTEADANGYVTYTVYVRTGTSSVTSLGVEFKLGTKDNQTKGTAFISDFAVKNLTKTDYNTAIENADFSKGNVKSIDLSTTSNNNNLNDTDTTTILFVVFSSILLVAALVIALVGSGIKKLPKHNTVTVENKFNPNKHTDTANPDDTKDENGGIV